MRVTKKYRIKIESVYSGLDEETFQEYIKNTFQMGNNLQKAHELLRDGKVTIESTQPDGEGKAETSYQVEAYYE